MELFIVELYTALRVFDGLSFFFFSFFDDLVGRATRDN